MKGDKDMTDMERVSVWRFLDEEFSDARGAYLADWQNGGASDTFARWIAAALTAHAERDPEKRAVLGRLDREAAGRTRSWSIPSEVVRAMRAAIEDDRRAGRWTSESAWCRDAIAAATEEARLSNGGELPTPPKRLPNQLRRSS